jgi:cathepsin L
MVHGARKTLFLLLLLLPTAAHADNCPGSKAFIHASCKMTVTFTASSCADVAEEVRLRVNGTDGWCDPHNKGHYALTGATATDLSLTRLTGNNKYTDKLNLLFTSTDMSAAGSAATGCVVSACSESQVTSVIDMSTNYCNLHDLMCGSKAGCVFVKHDLTMSEKLDSCSQHDASQCLKTCGPKADSVSRVFQKAPVLGDADIAFEDFLNKHNKLYADPSEHALRRTLFERSRKRVLEQNAAYEAGRATWWAAMNGFADLTGAELSALGAQRTPSLALREKARAMRASLPVAAAQQQQQQRQRRRAAAAAGRGSIPTEKTWMALQTPVKNQGSCGSCWAVGTTEVLETHLAIAENATAATLVLSPQSLVSCAKNPHQCGGTGGCGGATAEIGFNFTKSSVGMPLESAYPYDGKDGTCRTYDAAVTCSGYTKLESNSASAMEIAVATRGSVAVVVAAAWDNYGGGIFEDGCLSWLGSCTLDHVVVIVGYTQDAWLVRNSWGENWGESGYIRLTRKNDNVTYADTKPSEGDACLPYPKQQKVKGECGVLFDGSYPEGVKLARY